MEVVITDHCNAGVVTSGEITDHCNAGVVTSGEITDLCNAGVVTSGEITDHCNAGVVTSGEITDHCNAGVVTSGEITNRCNAGVVTSGEKHWRLQSLFTHIAKGKKKKEERHPCAYNSCVCELLNNRQGWVVRVAGDTTDVCVAGVVWNSATGSSCQNDTYQRSQSWSLQVRPCHLSVSPLSDPATCQSVPCQTLPLVCPLSDPVFFHCKPFIRSPLNGQYLYFVHTFRKRQLYYFPMFVFK